MGYNSSVKNQVKLKNIFPFVLITVAGFLLGQLLLKSFTKLTLSDFHVYYYVTKMVMKYQTHPYANFKPIYPYYFPPASLIIFWPLTMLPFYLSKIIFTLLNSGLLVLSIYLINKMIVGKINYHFWLMLILSLIFYPLRFTFMDGQFNVVMLAIYALGLFAFYKNKPILGGISLGIGSITKISPAIIVGYGAWKKKFNLVMIAGITVILLSLLSEQFVKKDINYYYAKFIIKDVSSQSQGLGPTDQSLLAFIKRIDHEENLNISSTTKSIISYSVVAVLGLAFLVVDLKAKKGKYSLFIDYFILTTIGVIGTGLAWYHQYTILLLPLLGTGLLCFTRFDKKYRKQRIAYFIGLGAVCLSWFFNLKSPYFSPKGYTQFIMLYGGALLLFGLYLLKINQKWLIEKDFANEYSFDAKKVIPVFIMFLVIGLSPWDFSNLLKEGRDEARVFEINYMSEVLKSRNISFRSESSNSFEMSNRVGKGYIRFGKGQEEKVLNGMSVLYSDPINNKKYNYSFSSTNGTDFELKARLESEKYIDRYGDFYGVVGR